MLIVFLFFCGSVLILFVIIQFLNNRNYSELKSTTKFIPSKNSQITSKDVYKIAFLNSKSLVKGKTNSAYDIGLRNDGKVYIPDYRNNKVDIFDKELNYISRIDDIPFPHGLTLDKDGFLYVAGYRKDRVLKFNYFGTEIVGWDRQLVEENKIKTPLTMAVDKNNDVYIIDYGLRRLIKVNKDGKFLLTFDISKIGGEDKFLPHDLTTDGVNYMYVADRGVARTIQIFTLDGEYVKSWKTPVADFVPLAVRFLNERLILIPNYTDSKIYLFDISGKFIKTLGRKGKKPAEFLFITNLISDENGYVYTVEEDGNRIQKINFNKVIDAYGR